MKKEEIGQARFKYKNVIIQMYFSDIKKAKKAVILAHGLPDSPLHRTETCVKNFVDRNFIVFAPHYIGTYDSFGKCNFENSVDTLLQTIDFAKKGKGVELWNLGKLSWHVKEIILGGGSYGGCTALMAGAKSKDVKKIIALAPVTNWRVQGKYSDEDMMEDYRRVKMGWINTWRVGSKKIWQQLTNGELDLNPIDYADVLKNKNILLIHRTNDHAVNIKQSIDFYKKIKKSKGSGSIKFVKMKGYDHLGVRAFGEKIVFNKITKWLRV